MYVTAGTLSQTEGLCLSTERGYMGYKMYVWRSAASNVPWLISFPGLGFMLDVDLEKSQVTQKVNRK